MKAFSCVMGVGGAAFFLLLLPPFLQTGSFAQGGAAAVWYEGGTLQQASVADWRQATPENQLATSADFTAAMGGIADIAKIKDPREMEEVRKRAEKLWDCVNRSAAQPEVSPDRAVAELVVVCALQGQR